MRPATVRPARLNITPEIANRRFGESVLEYADRKLRPRGMRSSFLNEQWRMTPTLCAVVSTHSYNGALIAAPEAPPPGLPPAFPDSIVVVDPAIAVAVGVVVRSGVE